MNEIKTVFGFTVRSAVRKKPFKISTIVLLVLILILCALPSLLSSDTDASEETVAEKTYNCYYIDASGLIPGGREVLEALLPGAEIVDGDIEKLDAYGAECDGNGSTLVVEVVERDGAPFINLYQGALANTTGVVDALNERYVA